MRPIVVVLSMILAAPVAAQPGAREEAQRLFKQGQAAYGLGKYEEAIALYERTYRLMRHAAFLYNIGQAYRKRWEGEKKVEFLRRALNAYQATVREDAEGKLKPEAEKLIAELSLQLAAEERKETDRLLEGGAAGEELRVGRKLLEEQRPEDARTLLGRLCRKAGTPRDVLAQAYLLRGKAAATLGDRAEAMDQFKRALVLQPSSEPAETRGPVRDAFAAAREGLAGARLSVVVWPPGSIKRGEPATVPVMIEGDPLGMVDTHELHYRAAKSGAYSTVRGKRGGALPLPPGFAGGLLPGARVEFFVRTLDGNGAVLAENGTDQVPYVFAVRGGLDTGGPTSHWYTKWWVWTIVGAVAAGAAGTGAYFGTRSSGTKMLTITARPK
jgi:tetratricopeptide (TPR) repeat protein